MKLITEQVDTHCVIRLYALRREQVVNPEGLKCVICAAPYGGYDIRGPRPDSSSSSSSGGGL